MTFIATVIAKKGAALIADSLVTTSKSVIEYDVFSDYLKRKIAEGTGEIKIDAEEVSKLFVSKPSYTKDYYEKIFKFDNYTAISTAGAAYINGKTLEDLINLARQQLESESEGKTIDEKVALIEDFFKKEALAALNENKVVRESVLLITHYNKDSHSSSVFKLNINTATSDSLKIEGFQVTSFHKQPDGFTVTCEGQNRISQRILWGDLDAVFEVIPKVAAKIFSDFKIKPEDIPENYQEGLLRDRDVLPHGYYEEMKIFRLRELSLQQAIDLAVLLLRLERDMQKYTENIPTVGGNVKIAIINEDGFRFLHGDTVNATL